MCPSAGASIDDHGTGGFPSAICFFLAGIPCNPHADGSPKNGLSG
jgi:hypothetical protein